MIQDHEIERAVDWLRDNAEPAAQARANREHLDKFLKTKVALLSNGLSGSEAMRTREALAHPEYLECLEGYKQAVFEDERMRNLRVAAEAKISLWQTQSANSRGKL